MFIDRLSIKWRVTVITGFSLILIIGALIAYFQKQSVLNDQIVEKSGEASLGNIAALRLEALGAMHAEHVQRYFMDTYAYSEAVSNQILFLQKQGRLRGLSDANIREDIVELLKTSLSARKELLSVYVVFEPNTVGGSDSDFIGKSLMGSNEAGRLAFYWAQQTPGQLDYLPTSEAELQNVSPGPTGSPTNYWYTCPLKTMDACVFQPFRFTDPVSGAELLASSLTLPLIANGKVVGVIGMDIRLNDLQAISESANKEIYEGAGHFSIISSEGLIAGYSRDSSKLTSLIDQVEPGPGAKLLEKVKSGKTETYIDSEVLRVVRPFRPVPTAAPWGVVLDLPKSTLYQPVQALQDQLAERRNSSRVTSIGIGLVAALIGLLCVWLIARGVSNPVLDVAARLRDIATGEGDITRRLDYARKDELGELSQEFNAFLDKLQPIITQVNDAVQKTRSTANRSAEVASQTSEGMQNQLREIDQVATASLEMSATAADVARSASQAANAVSTVDNATAKGLVVVQGTVNGIQRLAGQISGAMAEVESLASGSKRIGAVLEVIRAIAEQTNLLALNAAIEAARAGDVGRGFSVVADEVRGLARRTQESVEEIRQVIEGLQSGISQVVAAMRVTHEQAQGSVFQVGEAAEALQKIGEAVTIIADMSIQIASAGEEQSAVAEEITRNVSAVRDFSTSLSLQAGESSEVSQSLNQLANLQQKLMSQFRV